MKRLSTIPSSATKKDRLFPLHRSITEDECYTHTSSPITRFVYKLLGLAGPSTQPRSWHKSHSTTSITKSSVITSYTPPIHDSNLLTVSSTPLPHRRSTKISFSATIHPKLSSIEWDQLPSAPVVIDNNEDLLMNENEDDKCSVLSGITSSSSTSHNSSISSTPSCPRSPAMTALVSASLIPTRKPIITHHDFDDMPNILLENRKTDTEPVLTESIAEMLRPYIPRRYRIAPKWRLLYSLDQHGVSLHNLYSLMKRYEGPCMMIIKDADNQLFGAYLSDTLTQQTSFYGTGECFLWKLNKMEASCPKIKVYPWTGKNDYMILSDSDFIAIGGGQGKFGLWLNSELEKGYSNTCPTFDNDCLTLKPDFECIEMEIWGFTL